MTSRLAYLVVVAIVVAACSTGSTPSPAPSTSPSNAPPVSTPSAAPPVELSVYGAASLKGALAAAKAAYELAVPGTTLTIATDSSSALETQIEQGAPADVFLSADTATSKKLADSGLADGAAIKFAGNELVVVVPAGNPAGIQSPADLGTAGVTVIAAGDDVPITKYATQLVENLALEPGYPAGFVAAYGANIASREDNVKAIVAKIELGEGDAGIVYLTDAMASDKVETVDVPRSANVPATYAGVVIKASPNVEAARAFLEWFAGPDGQAILARFGFVPPP